MKRIIPADLFSNPARRYSAVLALAAVLVMLLPAPRVLAAPIERVYRVEARSFSYTPAELYANPGDRVTIELVAMDYVHGLSVDGYSVEVTADPGQTARLFFTADRAGVFVLRCTVPCGPVHPFMTGKLRVGPNWMLLRGIVLAVLAAAAILARRP